MPNIKPISDLKNYTAIVNQISYGNRIYLTKNGLGMYALIDMKELDDLDKQRSCRPHRADARGSPRPGRT